MDYIKVNGNSIPYANDVAMATEPNIVSEIVTLAGNTIADINGWKYSDITLSWDMLHRSDLDTLLNETNPMDGTFDFTFIDALEGEKTIKALRVGGVQTKTPFVDADGSILWTGISISLKFPECYS